MKKLIILLSIMLIMGGCSNQTKEEEKSMSPESAETNETTLSGDEITELEEKTVEEEETFQQGSEESGDHEDNSEDVGELVNERWEAVTNDRVKFRQEPSRNAMIQDVHYLNLHYNSFLMGTKLTVLGRSELKDKIDTIEDYWYYVQYSNGEDTQAGWVYGAFIEELDVKSNYVTDFKEEINWLMTYGDQADSSATDNVAQLEKVANGLIERNAEAIHIFKTTTLFFDPELPDSNGAILAGPEYPVISDSFKSFQDLETFLYSTYVKDYADHMLYTWKRDDNPLYINVDGELYVDSTYAGARGYYVDWKNYTLEISNVNENQADLKIFLINYDPGSYDYLTIVAKLIKQKDEWLLEEMVW